MLLLAKNKNILIIITSLRGGGAEKVASMLANKLNEQEYVVTICTLESKQVVYKINPNINVLTSPLHNLCIGPFKLLLLPIHSLYICYLSRKFKVSKTISFLHRPNIVNAISSYISGSKYYISERSLFSRSYSGIVKKAMKIVLRLCYSRVDRCIAISTAVKEELLELGVSNERIEVINNPIELSSQSKKKPKIKALGFVTVGRLIPSKNIDIIIEAFAKFNRKYPESTLKILGTGSELVCLKNKVKYLGLNNIVQFKGFVEDVNQELSKADVFLFASEYESFGNVLIEAAAQGLPAIVPQDLNSFVDIYPNSEGVISYSKGNLFTAMLTIVDEEKLNVLASQAYQNVLRFEKNSIFNKYIKVITE